MKTLDLQPENMPCTITGISGERKAMERLISIGLTVGTPLHVLSNKKQQPVLIYARDTSIALARKEAEKITIGKK